MVFLLFLPFFALYSLFLSFFSSYFGLLFYFWFDLLPLIFFLSSLSIFFYCFCSLKLLHSSYSYYLPPFILSLVSPNSLYPPLHASFYSSLTSHSSRYTCHLCSLGSSDLPHSSCSPRFFFSSCGDASSLSRMSEAFVPVLVLIDRSLLFLLKIRDGLTFRRSDVKVHPARTISVIPRLNLSDSPVTLIITHSVRGERAHG